MPQPIDLPFRGSKLRVMRHRCGMEQQDLADETARHGRRVRRERISEYENDKVVPSVAVFRVLVKALACMPDDLLDTPRAGAA